MSKELNAVDERDVVNLMNMVGRKREREREKYSMSIIRRAKETNEIIGTTKQSNMGLY